MPWRVGSRGARPWAAPCCDAPGGVATPELAAGVVAVVVVELAPPPTHVFASRSDCNSSVEGAGPSTTTRLTRRTT